MLTPASVKDYVEKNPDKVTRKESQRYPGLFVIKYKNSVFYNNLWDEFLIEMRGLVVDEDYNPVIMPFRKVFNRGENKTEFDRDQPVTAVRKINGFMAAATYVKKFDKVIVSTTGSLDSDFVRMAEDYINDEVKFWIRTYQENAWGGFDKPYTHLFEIVHKDDDTHPIKEQTGLYYLTSRPVRYGSKIVDSQPHLDEVSHIFGAYRPEWVFDRFSNIVKHNKTVKHEGFMVYSPEGQVMKLKSPYYLATKFLGRMKETKLLDLYKRPEHYKSSMDEEFYGLIDHIKNSTIYVHLSPKERFEFIREFYEKDPSNV